MDGGEGRVLVSPCRVFVFIVSLFRSSGRLGKFMDDGWLLELMCIGIGVWAVMK